MDDQLLLRYSRQILLPQIDVDGQSRLLEAAVLIVGLGGLGSPVSMYLAAAGVGRVVLVDHDAVELSNLQRQIVHATQDIGRPKVDSAHDRLRALNPNTRIEAVQRRVDDDGFDALMPGIDVVVDATDNFETRFAINRACGRHAVPMVSGAAIRFEGQVTVFRPGAHRLLVTDPVTGNAVEVAFEVSPITAERRNAVRNVQLQNALAVRTGGKALELYETASLPRLINAPDSKVTSNYRFPLWNTALVVALVLGLLSVEWVSRKLMNQA